MWKDQRALVCGASKGIGRAVAMALAQEGVQVVALARDEGALLSLKSELSGTGHEILVQDVMDKRALESQIQGVIRPDAPFTILVNNSGGPPGGPIREAQRMEFERAFEQHLYTNMLLTSLVLPQMMAQRYGRIVNVISTSVKAPLPHLGVSNTVRGAVGHWAKTLAGEVAEFGVTVNSVLPGATLTDRLTSIIEGKAQKDGKSSQAVADQMKQSIPMKRFGEAQEIAEAVRFLASPKASYITGVALPVDGGRTPCY